MAPLQHQQLHHLMVDPPPPRVEMLRSLFRRNVRTPSAQNAQAWEALDLSQEQGSLQIERPLPSAIDGVEFDQSDNGESVRDLHTTFMSRAEGIFHETPPLVLGVLCVCAVLTAVVGVAALLYLRTRRRRQKLLQDLTSWDGGVDQATSTKSAPTSRSPSPKLSKRMSFPDTGSLTKSPVTRGQYVRSVTVDSAVPDLSIPPERVQPSLWSPTGVDSKEQHEGGFSLTSYLANGGSPKVGSGKVDLLSQLSPSEDEEPHAPEIPQGRLYFSVLYDADTEQLAVTLIKVKDLLGRGTCNQPRDPFVKIFLLPDDRSCRMSKVKKKTLNPVYDETKIFHVPAADVMNRIVRFSVYDVDKRRVLHCLGHVISKLRDIDLFTGEILSSDLGLTVQHAVSLGELQVSLVFVPHLEKIKVGLHRARNLTRLAHYPKGTVAYVRLQLFCGHKCHRVKRTLAVEGGEVTTFNESLSFTVHGRQLDSCNLVISLMLASPRLANTGRSDGGSGGDRLSLSDAADVEYGRLIIGPFMYARGEELAHWQEMLTQPRKVSTRWHTFVNVAGRKGSSS